jgi:hypothetical protein
MKSALLVSNDREALIHTHTRLGQHHVRLRSYGDMDCCPGRQIRFRAASTHVGAHAVLLAQHDGRRSIGDATNIRHLDLNKVRGLRLGEQLDVVESVAPFVNDDASRGPPLVHRLDELSVALNLSFGRAKVCRALDVDDEAWHVVGNLGDEVRDLIRIETKLETDPPVDIEVECGLIIGRTDFPNPFGYPPDEFTERFSAGAKLFHAS